jgi:hypothetical protein
MSDQLVITSTDPILSKLDFKPYRSKVERRVVPLSLAPGDPETIELETPWGEKLNARKGNFLVSEVDSPDELWPVDPVIFDETYIITRPGFAVKKAITNLVPLAEVTEDPDHEVTVVSLEGAQTVRAGDFYLARGVHGEIWPIPKETIDEVMIPAELAEEYLRFKKEKSDHYQFSSENLVITSADPILSKLNFKLYRSKVERRVVRYEPGPAEPESMKIFTPWGTSQTANHGDFLVSNLDTPDQFWPVAPAIFEETYVLTRPGYAVKKTGTLLAPLTDLVDDPDREVTVVNLKDPATVRAGDFYLAQGVQGEIWTIPKETVKATMVPVEQADAEFQ